MLIEQITGVAITQHELEYYIICDDKDSPLYNDDDVNNINQLQHDKANNTEYYRDNNVDKGRGR
jgi:hypothetical protein